MVEAGVLCGARGCKEVGATFELGNSPKWFFILKLNFPFLNSSGLLILFFKISNQMNAFLSMSHQTQRIYLDSAKPVSCNFLLSLSHGGSCGWDYDSRSGNARLLLMPGVLY